MPMTIVSGKHETTTAISDHRPRMFSKSEEERIDIQLQLDKSGENFREWNIINGSSGT